MESYFRMIRRMILTAAKWPTGHFLQPQEPPSLQRLTPILNFTSSLCRFLQRSSYFSPSCCFQSCSLKPGYFPTGHNSDLRGTYFQNRHLRSGPWGLLTSSRRVLKKDNEDIEVIINSKWEKIEKIARLLDCPESSVAKMVSKDTRIVTSFPFAKVEAIIRLLLSYGFSTDSIVRYQCVFCWNIQTLTERIEGMLPYRKYQFSLAHVVYSKNSYHMNIAMLADEVKLMGSHPTRLSFLAELLNCEEEEVNEAIASGHRHLETQKLTKLKSIFDLVKHEFSRKEIMSNLQVLQMDLSVCEDRLTQMADAGVFGKDKMLQALAQNKYHYPIMFDLHVSNAAALKDHDNKFAYMQSRLECGQEEIVILLARAPTIKNVTPRRLKEILNILLDEFHFPPRMILRNHHLLFFSAKRLRYRWEILYNLSLSLEQTAADLIMTEEKFKRKYVKNKIK